MWGGEELKPMEHKSWSNKDNKGPGSQHAPPGKEACQTRSFGHISFVKRKKERKEGKQGRCCNPGK